MPRKIWSKIHTLEKVIFFSHHSWPDGYQLMIWFHRYLFTYSKSLLFIIQLIRSKDMTVQIWNISNCAILVRFGRKKLTEVCICHILQWISIDKKRQGVFLQNWPQNTHLQKSTYFKCWFFVFFTIMPNSLHFQD